jgi:hypothetical protein
MRAQPVNLTQDNIHSFSLLSIVIVVVGYEKDHPKAHTRQKSFSTPLL